MCTRARAARRMLIAAIALAGSLAAPMPPGAAAQIPAFLVSDVNQAAGSGSGSQPSLFTAVGSDVFFVACTDAVGCELHRWDGNEVMLVADIRPGGAGSDPQALVALGGQLLFSADDGVHGRELWRSDGTPAGTQLVKDIHATYNGFLYDEMARVGGRVVFAGFQDSNPEPWASDGTEAGTIQLAETVPGGSAYPPQILAAHGGFVYFSVQDASTHLWRTDGTPSGTVQLADLGEGTRASFELTTHRLDTGPFVLSAYTLDLQANLITKIAVWSSDGSAAGTEKLFEETASPGKNVNVTGIQQIGSESYFASIHYESDPPSIVILGGELWVSDGTTAGTSKLAGSASDPSFLPAGLRSVSGTLVFANGHTLPGQTPGDGEPWISDGTAAGTQRLADIHPTGRSEPRFLGESGGLLLFEATDGSSGRELWSTDGTPGGTAQLADIQPGPAGSQLASPAEAGGLLFFTADDGATGAEPWRSDGTPGGTFRLADIATGADTSSPQSLTGVGGALFFSANDGFTGGEPWTSDGTTAGTVALGNLAADQSLGAEPGELADVGDLLFFWADDGTSGREVWRSDGSEAGTFRTRDIRPGPEGSAYVFDPEPPPGATVAPLDRIAMLGSDALFMADDGTVGRELWKSDGTEAGTLLVKDLVPGPASSNALLLEPLPGEMLLGALTDVSGGFPTRLELWRSDGTSAGTALFTEVVEPAGIVLAPDFESAAVSGTLVFEIHLGDGSSGTGFVPALWRTDGTAAGTFRLAGGPGEDLLPMGLTVFDDEIFFVDAGPGSSVGSHLWSTDGSAAGTGLVTTVPPQTGGIVWSTLRALGGTTLVFATLDGAWWRSDGTTGGTLPYVTPATRPHLSFTLESATVDGVLYYVASNTGAGPWELWRTDGTAAGTALVRALPDAEAPPDRFVSVEGKAVFRYCPGGDCELWESNGTAEGTKVLADVNPGPEPSDPMELAVSGGHLFFDAFEPVAGRELWAVSRADLACGNLALDPGEACDGETCCTQSCTIEAAGSVCRSSSDVCDTAETCDGSSPVCPADAFLPDTTECRASAGPCDPADFCTGTGANCPADVLTPAGTECRAAADVCDVAESCTGAGPSCPADAFAAPGVLCRAAAGLCDVPELCDGTGLSCPADAVAPPGTVCRAVAGTCDVAETCDGAGTSCPADAFDVGLCEDGDACTVETCVAGSCQLDPAPDGTACPDGDVCNGGETCQGGACVAGAPLACGDADPCTADTCDPVAGCQTAPIPGCAAGACTARIGFEHLRVDDDFAHPWGYSVEEGDFRVDVIESSDGFITSYGTRHPSFSGSTAIHDVSGATLALTRSDGAPFGLCSLHVAERDGLVPEPTFEFRGQGQGPERILSSELDQQLFLPQFVDFATSGFRNLDSLTWRYGVGDGLAGSFQVDELCICSNCAPPPEDMVAWWTGDDCSADDRLGDHDGSYNPYTNCRYGWKAGGGALSVISTNIAIVPHHADLEPGTDDLTVHLWAKLLPGTPLAGFVAVLSKFDWGLALLDGSPVFTRCSGTACGIFPSGLPSLQEDTWHFLALSVDRAADAVSISLDGQSAVVHAPGAEDFSSPTQLAIGGMPWYPQYRSFSGALDEVAIHSRALAPEELEEIRLANGFGMCRFDVPIEIEGEGQGGLVTATIAGVPVDVVTGPGDAPHQIALTLAGAISGDPTLAAQQIEAVAVGGRVLVSNAEVQSVGSTDPGIQVTLAGAPPPGVPALGAAPYASYPWMALVALIAVSTVIAGRRRGV